MCEIDFEREKMMKKVEKLKVATHKLEVVWGACVVTEIVAIAIRNGWECNTNEVSDYVHQDPPWTWGDAAYTLIEAKVYVQLVLDGISETNMSKGKDFSFDYKFDLVALEG
jgi:hypothetical protein